MFTRIIAAALALATPLGIAATPTAAQVAPFPEGFRTEEVSTNGTTIHTRIGGKGPAVVLLHGYGETGDMWAPLAADLARDHTVIVPDLRGLGLSSKPATGFDKKTQAGDVAGVLDVLQVSSVDLVTHDIGNMVGFAFAAQYPQRVRRFALIDAPVPGVGPWEEILKNPLLWHFRFGGPDMERLVAGRERIYLDRFWNEFSATPARFSEAARAHYAQLYALPGAMHSGFAQFAAFDQDAVDNRALLAKGKLGMPVLAVGGEKSFGPMMATVMRFAATDVQEAVVPDSGHWIMEENPQATIAIVRGFLDAEQAALVRLTPREIAALPVAGAGAGTSGISAVRTTILSGDPTSAGPYTIALQVPPHTRIAAHSHRDSRVAVVVSGTWYFGYGERADDAALKTLPPGSFYAEPAGLMHFARTGDAPAVVYIFGNGPTDTRYADAAADPRQH
jgi:pimeloyl-ACP methyl ester carboxylesterase/quercetin dioxygenase-like cupin family protein